MRGRLGALGWLSLSLIFLVIACAGETVPAGSGGSGGSGGAPECVKPADCVPEVPECQSLVGCIDGKCAYENTPQGKPLSTQALGNCVQTVCDGQGSTESIPDATDAPTDGSECTEYTCDGTTPMKTIYPSIPCYTGPAGTEGVGACKGGMMTCNAMGLPEGECQGEVVPARQMCGPEDDDCDGQPGPACPP